MAESLQTKSSISVFGAASAIKESESNRDRWRSAMKKTFAIGILALTLGAAGANAGELYVRIGIPAPPPPPCERMTPRPGPGYIWVGGYYRWDGHRHNWVNGYWNAPRREERGWREERDRRYERDGDRYRDERRMEFRR